MKANILVVDDEPDLEDLVTQKFRRQIRDGAIAFGFARDGVEALAYLDGHRDTDMVITDINMPRMDGLTLPGKLQDGEDKLSTVIVSAYGDMANIRTAMNHGAFDFLTSRSTFPISRRRSRRRSLMSRRCAKRVSARPRRSARKLCSRAISHPISS